MSKLYTDGNYIVAEDTRDGGVVNNLKTLGSVYFKTNAPDAYSISSETGSIDIEVSDIGNWTDESGAVAFTEATLVEFLRLNTGA
jgi:hypothetical protein